MSNDELTGAAQEQLLQHRETHIARQILDIQFKPTDTDEEAVYVLPVDTAHTSEES